MTNKLWTENKNEKYQEYRFSEDKIYRYYIAVSIKNGIDYFTALNDKFKNYKKFLKIEDKIDLESKIKIAEIKLINYDSEEILFEKKLTSKKKSSNESLEEKDFYVFDLAPGGRSIEWGKLLSEEIEDYVNLCKKQVEFWEE